MCLGWHLLCVVVYATVSAYAKPETRSKITLDALVSAAVGFTCCNLHYYYFGKKLSLNVYCYLFIS